MRKYKRSVFKSLSLITQLGVSIIVPIALCVGAGVLIDNRFGTWWTLPLLFLGILAGGRNAYILAMSVVKDDENKSDTSGKMKNEDGKEGRQ